MKIIRITTLLDFGGQEKQYISFANQKNRLQNDYVFAAIGHGGFAEKDLISKGFKVKIFNQNPSISNLKNIYLLYKWLKEEQPDIVHTAAAEANFHGIMAAKLAGVKTIIGEEIGFPNHSKKARWVFRQIYKLTDKVIGVSQSVKNYLIEIKEIKEQKGFVLYNPVTPPKEVVRDKQANFTMVSVGRLEIVKNQQLLIRSMKNLKNQNVRLILVGDGRERKNLENLISSLDLTGRVTITGFIPDPERYLAKADVFVLPSLSEGFGIAAVEAMHLAIPCLCSNVGGIPEFIENGKTGWLFDVQKENDLENKLNEILTLEKSDLISIGLKGKMAVSSRFSEEVYVEKLENLYKSLEK